MFFYVFNDVLGGVFGGSDIESVLRTDVQMVGQSNQQIVGSYQATGRVVYRHFGYRRIRDIRIEQF